MAMEQQVETNERPVYDSNLQFIIASNEPPLRRLQRAPLLLNGGERKHKVSAAFRWLAVNNDNNISQNLAALDDIALSFQRRKTINLILI